jgi:hypothetical protein
MADRFHRDDRTSAPGPAAWSRRSFLHATLGVAGGALLARGDPQTDEALLDLGPGQAPSRVAIARSPRTLDGPTVHVSFVRELFEAALQDAVGATTPYDAWHKILEPEDIIGLKFNRSGQRVIATTDAVAEALVTSLVDAGFQRSRIVCIEAPAETTKRLRTATPRPGFDAEKTRFTSGADEFALVLRQVTALISVPFLKTHNLCTLTCALKNLSHGLIKHPARFHDNACSPYIADIVAAPPLRAKLRLAVVDALRVVYADGPAATSHNIADNGGLIVSTDCVSTDAIGLAVLNDVRDRAHLKPVATSAGQIPYLVAAHRAGLGVAAAHGIELGRIDG